MPALSDEGLVELAHRVIEAEGRAVNRMAGAIDTNFVRAARVVASAAGKILITGSGTSGTIAARAAHLMSVCGTPAFYLSPADGLHGGLGVLQPQDLVIALSKGGGSEELNEFCSKAKPLCAGVIAITAAPASALAAIADHVIRFSLDDDADLGSVVATGSSLAISALLDALAEIGRVSRDYDWRRLLYTHPSGAVGRDAATSLQRLADAGAKG